MNFENKEVFITGCTSRLNKQDKKYFVFTILGNDGGQTIDCMYTDESGDGASIYEKYLELKKTTPFICAKCTFKFIGGQYPRLQLEKIELQK